MSYKKNSKSRLARFMLALTIMGGVGQRLADNKSYALANIISVGNGQRQDPYDVISFDYFAKESSHTRVQNVVFNANNLYGIPGPAMNGSLNVEAQAFGRLMNCRLLDGGQVDDYGVYKNSGNYDLAKVKQACERVFSDSQVGVLKAFIGGVGDLPAGDKSNVGALLALLSNDYWNTDLVDAFDGNNVAKTLAANAKEPLEYIEKSKMFLRSFIEGMVTPDSTGADTPTVYLVIFNDGSFVFSGNKPSVGSSDVSDCVASKMSLDNFRTGFFDGYDYSRSFLDQRLTCNNAFVEILDVIKGFDSDFKGNFIICEGSIFHVDSAEVKTKGLNPLSVLLAIAEYKRQKDSGDVNMATVKAAYRSFDCALSNIASKEDLEGRYDSYVKFGQLSDSKEFKSYAVSKVWSMCEAIQGKSLLNSPINVGALLDKLEQGDMYEKVSGVLQVICSGLQVSVFETGDKTQNLVKFFKFLLGGNGDGKSGNGDGKSGNGDGRKDGKKDGKSSAVKPILVGAGILALLGGGGVALWKTGYGEKLVNKAKEFFNKNKNRAGLGKGAKVGTNPAPGKTNPVSGKINPI